MAQGGGRPDVEIDFADRKQMRAWFERQTSRGMYCPGRVLGIARSAAIEAATIPGTVRNFMRGWA